MTKAFSIHRSIVSTTFWLSIVHTPFPHIHVLPAHLFRGKHTQNNSIPYETPGTSDEIPVFRDRGTNHQPDEEHTSAVSPKYLSLLPTVILRAVAAGDPEESRVRLFASLRVTCERPLRWWDKTPCPSLNLLMRLDTKTLQHRWRKEEASSGSGIPPHSPTWSHSPPASKLSGIQWRPL